MEREETAKLYSVDEEPTHEVRGRRRGDGGGEEAPGPRRKTKRKAWMGRRGTGMSEREKEYDRRRKGVRRRAAAAAVVSA